MKALWTGMAVALLGAGPAAAQRLPPTTPRTVGAAGLGVLFGPGDITRARNAAGEGEVLAAEVKDGLALSLGMGFERSHAGLEIRVLVAAREPRVTNQAGDRFPHHAEPPLLWNVGVIGYPLPRFGRGIGRRLRPFAAIGAGGMLVRMDLDNRGGQSFYHPWQWNLAGGVRLLTSRENLATPLVTVLELRIVRHRLFPHGPIRGADLLAVTFGVGLQL